MAETVAAFGVPHTPNFPALVAKAGPDCETAKLYAEIAKRLRAAEPDDPIEAIVQIHICHT